LPHRSSPQRSTSEPCHPAFEPWWPKPFVRGLPWHWLLPSFILAQWWMFGWRSRVFARFNGRWHHWSDRELWADYQRCLTEGGCGADPACQPRPLIYGSYISVVLVVMNRFDLWDTLANMWTLILHVGVNFC
jgi:hypothetical protein